VRQVLEILLLTDFSWIKEIKNAKYAVNCVKAVKIILELALNAGMARINSNQEILSMIFTRHV
jgi:hypothetical protein